MKCFRYIVKRKTSPQFLRGFPEGVPIWNDLQYALIFSCLDDGEHALKVLKKMKMYKKVKISIVEVAVSELVEM